MSASQQLIKCVALCNGAVGKSLPHNQSLAEVSIDGVPVLFGVVPLRARDFDNKVSSNRFGVLVRIRAFSCNYRDKALLRAALQKNVENSFYPLGSEFMGEVVDVGRDVAELQPGDRVIGDNSYCGLSENSGIPTNHASRELQVFHYQKLIKVQPQMPDTIAAAFSLGAQTAYSIIRRLQLFKGSNVLITAARSNTSLFVINALRQLDVNIYATTTSPHFDNRFEQLGVRELVHLDFNQQDLPGYERLKEIARAIGGFNYVIDPFFDVHLAMMLAAEIMAFEAKYVTCGLARQYAPKMVVDHRNNEFALQHILTQAVVNNYQVIGNCLGLTGDLHRALQDYEQGKLEVIIDSVHEGDQVGPFITRTFNSTERFGKVVYKYQVCGN